MSVPEYNTSFDPAYGSAVRVQEIPLIRRVTAPNAGPYTFTGTNTFLIGRESVCVLDPGPDDPDHLDMLVQSCERGGGRVSHIVLTHTHTDHTAGVPALKKATGAKTFGFGRHMPAGTGGDRGFIPDVTLQDGDQLYGEDWALTAIHTPGHCRTHLCFAVDGTDLLLSGDHVMGWSSSVIIPPDGDLADYFDSLAKLETLTQGTYLPAHGGPITNGKSFAAAMGKHRRMRNGQILDFLQTPCSAEELSDLVYPGLKPELKGAAGATLSAHLAYLQHSSGIIRDAKGRWCKP